VTAPLYPVNTPINGISGGLFPFKVNAEFFREWIQITPFWNLMGTEMDRPIVRHQATRGNGFQYRVPKMNALDYTKPVINFDQVSGSGQYQSVDYDSVNLQGYSFAVPIKGIELLALGTPISLPESVRPQLIEACQQNFNMSLLNSAMFNYLMPTDPTGGYRPATQLSSYDRTVLAGKTPTRATYNGYAGLTTAWNSFTDGITYLQNGLSAKHLLNLKAMAVRGGNSNGAVFVNGRIEDAVRPAYMKTKGGWPLNEYIYLCNTESYTQLLQDPMYFQATTTRGVVVSSDQPESITGADYKGKYEGIHIYEIKDLSKYISLSLDGARRVGWELFIGGGAFSVGWDREPWIVMKDNVIDMAREYASHEIRGQKALVFPAKQASTVAISAKVAGVEQGIIHSFVLIGMV
jgi:hypothetical protein